MLALGELSKRSLGTFRWVRKARRRFVEGRVRAAARRDQQAVRADVLRRPRTTRSPARSCTSSRSAAPRRPRTRCKVPSRDVRRQRVRRPATAPTTRASQYTRGNGRGVLGWLLLVGGIVVGGRRRCSASIGYSMSSRSSTGRRQMPPGPASGHADAARQPRSRRSSASRRRGAAADAAAARLSAERPADSARSLIMSGPRTGERAPAPQRLSDRQAARLRPPDRGRLHVEPARADRHGRAGHTASSTTAARRTARSSTACASPSSALAARHHASGSARPRSGSWQNRTTR